MGPRRGGGSPESTGRDEPGTRLRVRLTIHTHRATITQHRSLRDSSEMGGSQGKALG